MRQWRPHRAGVLASARVDLLTALPGCVWDYQADRWAQFEDVLRSYVAREGHARVPQAHGENGYRLGQKVANLRLLHSRGELSRERTEQLERLPGWNWAARSSPRGARPAAALGPVIRRSSARGDRPSLPGCDAVSCQPGVRQRVPADVGRRRRAAPG